jgi:peptidoglycan/LPS O-acetylase OafA/YrhL
MNLTQRHAFVDLLRCLSVLYIVGFWHLLEYTSVWPGYYSPLTARVTVIVLGLFVFLSGWLLGQGTIEPCVEGFERFYLKRLLRIYPLYLGAIGLFALCHLGDTTSLLKAALLLSMFSGPTPPTLWFITMVIVFYGAAPFLIHAATREPRFWELAASLFGALVLLSSLSTAVDPRLVMYFPAFVCGIYFARFELRRPQVLLASAWIGCFFSIVLSYSTAHDPEHTFWSVPLACLGPLSIFLVAWRYKGHIPNSRWLTALGYVSFVMFLIHRPVYVTIKSFYFPSTGLGQLLYLTSVCLPVAMLVSWIIQSTYDTTLRWLPDVIRREWARFIDGRMHIGRR